MSLTHSKKLSKYIMGLGILIFKATKELMITLMDIIII
ncbi:hypothetical protein ND00_02650 [Clostridium sp. L74]|nr:hypothetical protein ND00_02650 [Clostridium sp. L74]